MNMLQQRTAIEKEMRKCLSQGTNCCSLAFVLYFVVHIENIDLICYTIFSYKICL